MSRYYTNYTQYLGAQRCCDFRGQGPQGLVGPTGPSAIGQRGLTGPTGSSVTGPTGRSCRGDTGPRGPAGSNISMLGGLATISSTNNTLTTYFGGYAAGSSLEVSSTETQATTYIPFNCTISNLYIYLTTAPGISTSYTYTIRKNNIIDTSVTVTISGASSQGSDLTNTATFTAGDIFTISCVPDGTPNLTSVRWTCKLTST